MRLVLICCGILLSALSPLTLSAQIEQQDKIPNYIQRNQDFQTRRATLGVTNFGIQIYTASKELPKSRHAKAEKPWAPRGPFGTEPLAGIGRVNSMQFHPTDTNTWFICVAQGGIWKTTNAGQSWISISGDLPVLRTSYVAVHPTNTDIMYLATGDYAYLGHNLQANENKRNSHYGLGVYKTTDGGEHWKPTGLSFEQTDFEGSLIAKIIISKKDPNTVIAVGQTGSYVTYDSGDNWTRTSSKLFWDLEQDPTVDSILYASTGYVHAYKIGEVSILKSTDFGATWIKASTPMPATGAVQRVEIAIAPSDPSTLYALACDTEGGFYGFYRSTDAGESFSARSEATSYYYNILNHSLDNTKGGQGRYDLALSVDRHDKNKVLTGGVNMWQTTDGGVSFKTVTYWRLKYQGQSLHADIHEIVQHPTNHTIFACHDGGLSRSFKIVADNVPTIRDLEMASTEWTDYTNGLNVTSFYRLSINELNTNELMAGAQDNSTVYTADTSFFNLSGGDGMESEFIDASTYRYTSSQNGNIFAFYTDGSDFIFEGNIRPPTGEYGEWTTPMVEANDELYILYGNLYSATGWFLSAPKSNFGNMPGRNYPKLGTALAVERSTAQQIYLAKRGYASEKIKNEIWASTNGGDSWDDIGNGLPDDLYPSYMEMSQKNTDEVWITFSGFHPTNKVFYSDNGGDSWTNITYDLPNIPVNCVVHQNDSTEYVYIGTDLGVYYLEKDSSKWVRYSSGLPNVIVSELEIDTANRTLVAATFGRGLWDVELVDYKVETGDVGLATLTSPSAISLFPNPVNSTTQLSFGNLKPGTYPLRLVDITGKEVAAKTLVHTDVNQLHELEVSTLRSGEYFILISTPNGRMVQRFVKK